jgi:hypothetical protein
MLKSYVWQVPLLTNKRNSRFQKVLLDFIKKLIEAMHTNETLYFAPGSTAAEATPETIVHYLLEWLIEISRYEESIAFIVCFCRIFFLLPTCSCLRCFQIRLVLVSSSGSSLCIPASGFIA